MTTPTLATFADRLRRTAGHPTPADRDLLTAYLQRRDEAAFADLVRRHGPRVWATVRKVLPEQAAAEDAFQAVFLVLVAKARRVDWQADLGGWLAAVAHRVAVRARARGGAGGERRRKRAC